MRRTNREAPYCVFLSVVLRLRYCAQYEVLPRYCTNTVKDGLYEEIKIRRLAGERVREIPHAACVESSVLHVISALSISADNAK